MRWLQVCGGALLTVLVGAAMWAADACWCTPPPPPKAALAASTAVFLGKVTKLEDDPGAANHWKVTIQVEGWWKGGNTRIVAVSTHKHGATCGYHFKKGDRYLVYAHGKSDRLQVSLCSRTSPFAQADKSGDFKELGDGKAPTK